MQYRKVWIEGRNPACRRASEYVLDDTDLARLNSDGNFWGALWALWTPAERAVADSVHVSPAFDCWSWADQFGRAQ